jgi:hypothetical protein
MQAELLTEAIKDARDVLLRMREYPDIRAVNEHFSEGFADIVEARLPLRFREAVAQVGMGDFLCWPTQQAFDREYIAENWPAVAPPEGMAWEDIERALAESEMLCSHTWMEHAGVFYDVEMPEGVENFFALPIFQRVFHSDPHLVPARPTAAAS